MLSSLHISKSMCWTLIGLCLFGCSQYQSEDFQPEEAGSLSVHQLLEYTNTDSTLARIDELTDDYERLDSLFYFAHWLRHFDGEAALIYANEAYKLATLGNEEEAKAISLYYQALLKTSQRKFGEGGAVPLADIVKSRKLFKRLKKPFWLAKAQNLTGIIFYREDNIDSARFYQNLALETFKTITSPERSVNLLTGEIYHDLGNTYEFQDTATALQLYRKSLNYYEQAQNPSAVARLLGNVGDIYADHQQFEQALPYFEQSLELASQEQDRKNLSELWLKLGTLYLGRYKLEPHDDVDFFEARMAFDSALAYQRENLYVPYAAIGLGLHTRAAFNDDPIALDSALYYYKQTLVHAREEGAIVVMQTMVNDISILCNYVSSPAGGERTICEELFETSPQAFLIQGYESIVDTVTTSLQEANQSIVDFERDEVEIQARLKRRNQLFVSAGVLLLATLVFLILLQRHQKKRLQARMDALRAQINPHFISNSLNAIEHLVNQNETKAAAKYLIHFSRLSRRILNGSIDASTSLKDELKTLEHFLALEQLRFRDKLNYEMIISPDLEPNLIEVPAMILQPYVENAILHGIKPKEGSSLLRISAERIGKDLVCTVEDDGIGREKAREIKAASVLKHKSVGMKITEERLAAIGQTKGAKVEIVDLKNAQGNALGTRVIVRLPFKLKPVEEPA